MRNFSFEWYSMKKWGVFRWSVFTGVIFLIGNLIYTNFKFLIKADVWLRYAIWIIFVIGTMYFNTIRLRPEFALHIHHYFVALLLLTFIGYQHPVLTLVHGYLTGMFIEGGCNYGFDPVWETTKVDNPFNDYLVKVESNNQIKGKSKSPEFQSFTEQEHLIILLP